jgi:hypothetical protein
MRYTLLVLAAFLVSGTLSAQTSVANSSNIASQPLWGPTGYDQVKYYYLPDIETYYDVPRHEFYYYDLGRWIGSSQLPPRYTGFDLYHSYKVVINESKAYQNNKQHRQKYASFKERYDQPFIRDSHDSRYYVIKGHPEHNKWVNRVGYENGKGNGNSNGNKGGDKQ